MQLIFAFTFNTETQEATFAGNIESQAALQLLQQIVIVEAVRKALEEKAMAEGHKASTEEK